MCGRYALYGPISRHRRDEELLEQAWTGVLFDRIDAGVPRYNVSPTQHAPVVVASPDGIEVHDMRWGLVPFWARDIKIGSRAINAREETVEEKPMFRAAFRDRRCLVPASGYFEWKGAAPHKQPYYIHDAGGELMLFAGLWERWRPVKDAEPVLTYTIVTGPPGLVSGDIHDRAPVVLPSSAWEAWLLGPPADARTLLQNVTEPPLAYHPVSKAVGSPRNDRPDLVVPVDLDV